MSGEETGRLKVISAKRRLNLLTKEAFKQAEHLSFRSPPLSDSHLKQV